MQHRLRIFTGEEDTLDQADSLVNVRFGEIADALAEAVYYRRTWVSDFSEDEVKIPADLYAILTAYSHLRPGA
ncbi:hypothetical protein [Gimesia panareensis]|uniref:Uncharacterized protein n=1 Tax=Gimesia panareensis TaxID=2527978 RepID=A0A517Q2B3_9PLAN|nr:hypothetical protein [Gimesia panareensis]QDT25758.1 hypothetical protein Enr10x_10550 [Gimesia panareensis]QDU48696.1 hypothetical protein Pan110_10110 [Gimesia panareensis]QDV18144.1 hypothetical protein Pan153_28010 [Gimesia panareensis]